MTSTLTPLHVMQDAPVIPVIVSGVLFLFASQVYAMFPKVTMWTGFMEKLFHPLSQLSLEFGF